MALLGGLAGCTYRGAGIDNPIVRRATWFSFVSGDDIRASCRPGTVDRYRLIYNGFWLTQVRIYELGLGQLRQLDIRVLEAPDLTRFTTTDLLAPWRGTTVRVALDAQRYGRLVAAFENSDLFGPPPVGLMLPSDGYYWTAVVCRGGVFHHNAWLYPSTRFESLSFPRELLALDASGVAFNPPDPMGYVALYDQRELAIERWYIKVEDLSFSEP